MPLVNVNSPWFTNLTAQFAHFFAGAFIVQNFVLHGHPSLGMIGFAAYAAVKEFVIDKYVEGQPFWDNITDFTFYFFGAAVGRALGAGL